MMDKRGNKYRKICDERRISSHQKYIQHLNGLSIKYGVPKNILIGIYFIETSFRPLYFRICEYIFVILGVLLNFAFKVPLKNYTIGRCQIGISSILIFSGKDIYKHSRYIKKVSKSDFLNIVKAMHYKRNLEISALIVRRLYVKSFKTANNYNNQLRHIGENYNGRYSYGLLLDEIVSCLDKRNKVNKLMKRPDTKNSIIVERK